MKNSIFQSLALILSVFLSPLSYAMDDMEDDNELSKLMSQILVKDYPQERPSCQFFLDYNDPHEGTPPPILSDQLPPLEVKMGIPNPMDLDFFLDDNDPHEATPSPIFSDQAPPLEVKMGILDPIDLDFFLEKSVRDLNSMDVSEEERRTPSPSGNMVVNENTPPKEKREKKPTDYDPISFDNQLPPSPLRPRNKGDSVDLSAQPLDMHFSEKERKRRFEMTLFSGSSLDRDGSAKKKRKLF